MMLCLVALLFNLPTQKDVRSCVPGAVEVEVGSETTGCGSTGTVPRHQAGNPGTSYNSDIRIDTNY